MATTSRRNPKRSYVAKILLLEAEKYFRNGVIMTKRSLFLVRFSSFVAFTAFIQLAGLPQPITGPLINAILFIGVGLMGSGPAILIGIVTPVAALVRGQLPAPLAVMVPFIMLANAVLVVAFNVVRKMFHAVNSDWLSWRNGVAFVAAAAAKFLFLVVSVRIFLPLFLGKTLPEKLAFVMMTPQLATALVGGVLALLFLKMITRRGLWREKD
jgi:hypothetical protein